MTETPEQIAARYGARLAPGVTVQQIPRGVSARPLPVWNGLTLICPDWKEERARAQAATMKAARRARARDPQIEARRETVRQLHAQGLSLERIVAVSGIASGTVRNDLHAMGLRNHLDATALRARLSARANERAAPKLALIARLIEDGADEARIQRETGIQEKSWLRRLIRRVKPDFVFVNQPSGRKSKERPAKGQSGARPRMALDVLAARLIPLLQAGETQAQIAARFGLTRGGVAAQVARLRMHGLWPVPGDVPERRAA